MPQPPDPLPALHWRTRPHRSDAKAIRDLVIEAGVFSPEEIDIAEELIRERLQKGLESGYEFLFAEIGDALAGYACFGRIPLTRASFDLYWIVVAPRFRCHGIGRQLMLRVEERLRARGGGQVYIETSSRQPYEAARRFYLASGYEECARFADFYAPGDAKVVFVKRFLAVRRLPPKAWPRLRTPPPEVRERRATGVRRRHGVGSARSSPDRRHR